ncbi:hypothetical protein H0H87_010735, partial [Tephrocybe sp. NHM501043]
MEFRPEGLSDHNNTSDNGDIDINTQSMHSSNKIAQPSSELGRPNSGSFNLGIELTKTGWSKEDVTRLGDTILHLAKKQLNLTLSYKKQDPKEIKKLFQE